MILGGVGHRNGGAIDDLDLAPFPEMSRGSIALHLLGDVGADLGEGRILKPGASLTISWSLRRRRICLWEFIFKPGDNAAQCMPTGRTAFEHLCQERPKGNHGAKDALPTIELGSVERQERLGDEIAKGALELAERAVGRVLLEQLVDLGAASFAKEQRAKSGKKRSG